jgi:hypothetical protein
VLLAIDGTEVWLLTAPFVMLACQYLWDKGMDLLTPMHEVYLEP